MYIILSFRVPAEPEKVNHQARHYQLDCICDVKVVSGAWVLIKHMYDINKYMYI